MKLTKFALVAFLAGSVYLTSCDSTPNRENTEDVAEEANEEKIEATTSDNSVADEKEDAAEFMVAAASGGMMEVELANLAMQKASSPQVKEFASMMIKDHKKANDEIQQLASAHNITLPTALIDKHQKVVNDLKDKKAGKDFDAAYMDAMVKDHKDDVKEFKEAADDLDNADIKAFASKTVPTLEHHLAEAEKIEDMVD